MLPNLSQKQASSQSNPLPTEAVQQNTETSSPLPTKSHKSPPGSAPVVSERQVKYLGLVIEKDDEQIIERDGEQFMTYDAVKRQYVPIRDKYIKIVKSCRKLTVDSFDTRGRKDFKRTARYLRKVGSYLKEENNGPF